MKRHDCIHSKRMLNVVEQKFSKQDSRYPLPLGSVNLFTKQLLLDGCHAGAAIPSKKGDLKVSQCFVFVRLNSSWEYTNFTTKLEVVLKTGHTD